MLWLAQLRHKTKNEHIQKENGPNYHKWNDEVLQYLQHLQGVQKIKKASSKR